MSEHTPGPWTVYPMQNSAMLVGLSFKGEPESCEEELAIVYPTTDGGRKQAKTNARLIAAAPDQNDALKALVRWIENIPGDLLDPIIQAEGEPPLENAWAAIAKACATKAEGGTE